MAESTLTADYADIARDFGRAHGFRRDSAKWTADQNADFADCLRDGYQMFLNPPVLNPKEGRYTWKWLRPIRSLVLWATTTGTTSGAPVYAAPNSTITATVAAFENTMVGQSFTFDTSGTDYTIVSVTSSTVLVVSGDASSETSGDTYTITASGDYGLPDDFAGVDGNVIFDDTTALGPVIEQRTPEWILRKRQSNTASTGTPQYFAITSRTFDATVGQRFDLLVYPVANRDFTVQMQMWIQPDLPTATNKYGLGGMPHSRTLLEAVLAAGELKLFDAFGGHYQAFLQALESSISFDRKAIRAESVGFNRDPGLNRPPYARTRIVGATYNGVAY